MRYVNKCVAAWLRGINRTDDTLDTSLRRRFDRVPYEKRTDGYGRSLVKENKH